jgi:hypothetical protein
MVLRMSQRDERPIANTQMFRAFVERGEPDVPAKRSNRGLLLGVIAAVAVVAIIVVVLLVR